MPLPVIANVFRVSFNWLGHGGETARSVAHFQMVGGTPATLFAALDAHVTAGMWSHTDGFNGITTVDMLKLDGTSGTISFATGVPARWVGVGASSDYEVAPAVLVKAQTGFRGPAKRGRLFLPWPSEANVSNGLLSGTIEATMQAAWSAFQVAMVAVPAFPVVASYVHQTAQLITGYVVEQPLGTQRRRQQRLRR